MSRKRCQRVHGRLNHGECSFSPIVYSQSLQGNGNFKRGAMTRRMILGKQLRLVFVGTRASIWFYRHELRRERNRITMVPILPRALSVFKFNRNRQHRYLYGRVNNTSAFRLPWHFSRACNKHYLPVLLLRFQPWTSEDILSIASTLTGLYKFLKLCLES